MGILPVLGLAAVALYAMARPSKASLTLPSGGSHGKEADLLRQAMASQDGFFIADTMVKVAKSGALTSDPQLKEAFTLLQEKLSKMKASRDVTAGRSGRRYRMQIVNVFADGVTMTDIFTASGSKLMRFRLEPDGTKKFVTATQGADPALVKKACEDFNVPLPE